MALPCSNGAARPRVALFPLPYHGHLNPMFRLAAALHARGLAVTVLHAEHLAPDPANHPADYRFVAVRADVPAGLMASQDVAGVTTALNAIFAAPFKDRLRELLMEGGVRCVVTDVLWYSAQAAARELGVPALGLMTSSAASFRTFMAYPILVDKGYLPVQESRKDDLVQELPPFRVKDLQRIDASSLAGFASVLARVVAGARQSSGLILNTCDAIEATDVIEIRDKLSVPVFAVGPLHKIAPPPSTKQPDPEGCLVWLDTQAPGSVLFVSLGTYAVIEAREFAELARALAVSNRPFLWVVRPNLVRDDLQFLPSELEEEATRGRGRIVPWAPQEEVLAHPAVGAFLTHNGWNSTVEAVSEGVPMVCRPCFGDQLGTARYVCGVWRVGVELGHGEMGDDRLERADVQAAIEKVTGCGAEGKRIRERMRELKERTDECVKRVWVILHGFDGFGGFGTVILIVSSFGMENKCKLVGICVRMCTWLDCCASPVEQLSLILNAVFSLIL